MIEALICSTFLIFSNGDRPVVLFSTDLAMVEILYFILSVILKIQTLVLLVNNYIKIKGIDVMGFIP